MINIYFLIFLSTVVISSFSQILLKKSAMITYSSKLREYLNVYVVIGYALMFLSMLLTILAYKGVEYKSGPLIESLGNVLVLILSYYFFKEKISIYKIVGMVLIISGFIMFYI